MPTKVAVLFQQGNTGWSEVYYRAPPPNEVAIDTVVNQFYQFRRPMLAPQVSIVGFRFSDTDDPRKVIIRSTSWRGSYTPGLAPLGTTGQVDLPFVAVLAAQGTAGGFRRVNYLRGVPDFATDTQYRVIVEPNWRNAFNAFAAIITNGLYGGFPMKPSDNPKKWISNVSVVLKKIRLTVIAHGYTSNDKVRVTKLVSSPPLNGVWRILKIDDDTFDLIGSDTALTAIPFDSGGQVYSQRHSYDVIISMGQSKITRHGVGRPFDLPRSRRRKAPPKLPLSLGGSYAIG